MFFQSERGKPRLTIRRKAMTRNRLFTRAPLLLAAMMLASACTGGAAPQPTAAPAATQAPGATSAPEATSAPAATAAASAAPQAGQVKDVPREKTHVVTLWSDTGGAIPAFDNWNPLMNAGNALRGNGGNAGLSEGLFYRNLNDG